MSALIYVVITSESWIYNLPLSIPTWSSRKNGVNQPQDEAVERNEDLPIFQPVLQLPLVGSVNLGIIVMKAWGLAFEEELIMLTFFTCCSFYYVAVRKCKLIIVKSKLPTSVHDFHWYTFWLFSLHQRKCCSLTVAMFVTVYI